MSAMITISIELPLVSYRALKKAAELCGIGVKSFVTHSAMDKATRIVEFFSDEDKGAAPSDSSIPKTDKSAPVSGSLEGDESQFASDREKGPSVAAKTK